MQLFGNKNSRIGAMPQTQLDNLLGQLQRQVNQAGAALASSAVARAAISMESIDSTQRAELDSAVDGLSTALEGILATAGNAQHYTASQRNAAVAAAVISGDIGAALHATPVQTSMPAMEGMKFFAPSALPVSDASITRMKVALEAYDEKENRNAVTYSVAYNMQAARQDEFGEAFFPTVVVTPDQVGYAISIRLITVYNEVRRQISGDFKDFGKRNIIEAVIDPTILRNDSTRVVPVFRNESKHNFVDENVLTPRDILFEDTETVTTSALKIGKTFSLVGISQTEALLETGLLDSTDALDPAVTLDAIYVRLKAADPADDEVVRFSTGRLPLANFTYSVQDNYRKMVCAFNSKSLQVNGATKKADGSASALLAAVAAGNYSIRLATRVSGDVNLETAETSLFASDVSVARITDEDGNLLSLDTGTGATLAALFADAEVIGYDLEARRANTNRRERGQLLDTTFYTQVYAVPLRSPITVPRPLQVGDQNDSSDLAALITATHIRTSNAAVDELLRVADMLKEYTYGKDALGSTPEILGVARWLVSAIYEEDSLDVDVQIDSLKSHERAADIQAVLVNKLRDMAYRMYRDSGYKAAADALAGGVAPTPTVIIGTDPVISRYLTVTGDLRTLGNDFNVKIVSTLNERMRGKIVMSFGHFGEGFDGQPNPLHFGNMAWKPELTLVLPLHRNGQNSKELTVQPSFLHVTNLPVMGVVEVTGIKEIAASKVPVHTKEV